MHIIHVYVCVHAYMYTDVYIYVYYIHMHVCVCIFENFQISYVRTELLEIGGETYTRVKYDFMSLKSF